jgi:hypothetical protein
LAQNSRHFAQLETAPGVASRPYNAYRSDKGGALP